MVKCLPAVQETWVLSLGLKDPLEKEMATHSSTLAWKIPWTEEACRLQSMGLQSWTWLRHLTSLHFMVTLCLAFWETAKLFSKVAASFYILTSNVWAFQFFHIFVNTCWCVFLKTIIIAIPFSVKWYPIVLLMCISSMHNHIEQFFHVLTDHFYIFFKEMSIQIFCLWFKNNLCFNLFLIALSLGCCTWSFSSCSEWGYFLVWHMGLSLWWLRLLRSTGSRAHGPQ